jgi:4a-hydroxytetrahydrobiopterin dehydratase
MSDLASRTCVPCRGGTPPLEGGELEELARQLPAWEVVGGHHLRREFRFANFREALDFVNRVGELAEEQAHHPDVDFGWGRAGITIFTHKIDGLTESDFVLAAKVDRLYPA